MLWDQTVKPAFARMQLLSFTDIGTMIVPVAYAVGAAALIVFTWWGVRKATKIIMSAFRNGSLRM